MRYLFENRHQWKVFFLSGCKKFLWGFCRIVTCIILGIVSVMVWLWRLAVSCVGRHPDIALGGFLVAVAVVWLLMFAQMRATKVGLESQRDSIAWQYQNFKESHGYE